MADARTRGWGPGWPTSRPGPKPRPLLDRFWEHVRFIGAGPDDCHDWDGKPIKRYGYGQIVVGPGHVRRAHRVAWELTYGPIPYGVHVLHRCDRPICCNPRHLFLGTQATNMQDMWAKQRGYVFTKDDIQKALAARGVVSRG